MAKFNWKTEGTKPTMTVVGWPPSVMLLAVIGAALVVTCPVTQKVSEQEKKYQKSKLEYEDRTKLKEPNQGTTLDGQKN